MNKPREGTREHDLWEIVVERSVREPLVDHHQLCQRKNDVNERKQCRHHQIALRGLDWSNVGAVQPHCTDETHGPTSFSESRIFYLNELCRIVLRELVHG